MTGHPAATKALTNAIAEAFSNRTVLLYYFYSDDEKQARASHYYPNIAGLPDVVLNIRENQQPIDEFISILFETINSTGEKQFSKLLEDAGRGSIAKDEFVKAILKIEFNAMKRTRDIIKTIEFSESEKFKSENHQKLIGLSDDFENFVVYLKKVSPERDSFKEYELRYDAYRKLYKDYEAKRDASK